jgi:C1A family cysteine protease
MQVLKIVTVGTIVSLAAANNANKASPINHQMVARIRDSGASWIAHDVETNPFRDYSREQLLALVSGTYIPEPRDESDFEQEPSNALPTNFDPRTEKFSKCIHPIRDQAQCGSCWAFGATEALSDRFCIAGKDVILSPQDLVSCDGNNYGCDGGYLNLAW